MAVFLTHSGTWDIIFHLTLVLVNYLLRYFDIPQSKKWKTKFFTKECLPHWGKTNNFVEERDFNLGTKKNHIFSRFSFCCFLFSWKWRFFAISFKPSGVDLVMVGRGIHWMLFWQKKTKKKTFFFERRNKSFTFTFWAKKIEQKAFKRKSKSNASGKKVHFVFEEYSPIAHFFNLFLKGQYYFTLITRLY